MNYKEVIYTDHKTYYFSPIVIIIERKVKLYLMSYTFILIMCIFKYNDVATVKNQNIYHIFMLIFMANFGSTFTVICYHDQSLLFTSSAL